MTYSEEHDAYYAGGDRYYRVQKNPVNDEWQVHECTMGITGLDCRPVFPIPYTTKEAAEAFVIEKAKEWKEAHPDTPKPKRRRPRGA